MAKFSTPVASIVERYKKDNRESVQKFVRELFQDVMQRSPVLTGQFRANWNVSYGTPDTSIRLGATDYASRNQEQLAKLETFEPGLMWLTNGLDYAVKLENGTSQKAPLGMVKIATIDAVNSFK